MYTVFSTQDVRDQLGVALGAAPSGSYPVPGNPGVFVLSNGQFYHDPGASYSISAFESVLRSGGGRDYVAWMKSKGLPIAYGNPTTERQYLAQFGIEYYDTPIASNPIYGTTFASTGTLPPDSTVTFGAPHPAPTSPLPASAFPGTPNVTPASSSGSGQEPASTGGNYTSSDSTPSMASVLKGNGPLLIGAALIGAYLLMGGRR